MRKEGRTDREGVGRGAAGEEDERGGRGGEAVVDHFGAKGEGKERRERGVKEGRKGRSEKRRSGGKGGRERSNFAEARFPQRREQQGARNCAGAMLRGRIPEGTGGCARLEQECHVVDEISY